MLTCGIASSRSHISQNNLAKSSSEIGCPSILIRSLTKRRCGEVYSPTLDGRRSAFVLRLVGRYWERIDEMNVDVDPFPLVPAI